MSSGSSNSTTDPTPNPIGLPSSARNRTATPHSHSSHGAATQTIRTQHGGNASAQPVSTTWSKTKRPKPTAPSPKSPIPNSKTPSKTAASSSAENTPHGSGTITLTKSDTFPSTSDTTASTSSTTAGRSGGTRPHSASPNMPPQNPPPSSNSSSSQPNQPHSGSLRKTRPSPAPIIRI